MPRLIAICGLMLALSGCAVASGEITDTAIGIAGKASDRIIARMDELQAEIAKKQARIAKIKCLSFPAMQRYAMKSEANRLSVERDCHVRFGKIVATVQ